ncbi:polyprenol monophosphomannose synthase [Chloroflexi bacterium TSY]|nr:polyprenol monophosphomannose synthase [Chloroflexi bacterium TSY]
MNTDTVIQSNLLVCTLLPTFNEHDNIGPLIDGVLESAITRHMVLVVDDDSPDGTWRVVQERMKQFNTNDETKVVLERRINESGLTSAIQRGIDLAIQQHNADIITWMDCDLSMPPQDIPKLITAIIEQRADMAVGSRWIKGGADIAHGPMARALSWIINHFAILVLGNQVHDYTSGFIAARASVLQKLRLRGDYGEYCIDLLGRALQAGYKLQEVPYICVPRTSGESKTGVNLWDYLVKGRKYVRTIVRLSGHNSNR